MIIPDIYVIVGSRILDYSGMTKLDQVKGLLSAELYGIDETEQPILVSATNDFDY